MPLVNGQFIDKSQLGQQVGQQIPAVGASGATTSGLGDISSLQKLLGVYALSKGNPTGAWSILSQEPKDTTGTTPAEKSRAQTGVSVAESAKNVSGATLKKTGTLKAALVNLKLNFPMKMGQLTIKPDEQDLVDLNTKYFLLTQAVLTSVQGSRPSDYDVKSYQNSAGPNIMLPYYVNQQRIENMLNLLRSKTGQQPLPTRPSLESFNQ